jgi:hypothetical protein
MRTFLSTAVSLYAICSCLFGTSNAALKGVFAHYMVRSS